MHVRSRLWALAAAALWVAAIAAATLGDDLRSAERLFLGAAVTATVVAAVNSRTREIREEVRIVSLVESDRLRRLLLTQRKDD